MTSDCFAIGDTGVKGDHTTILFIYSFILLLICLINCSMKSLNNFVLLIRYIEKDMHYRFSQTYKIRAGVYVLTNNDS